MWRVTLGLALVGCGGAAPAGSGSLGSGSLDTAPVTVTVEAKGDGDARAAPKTHAPGETVADPCAQLLARVEGPTVPGGRPLPDDLTAIDPAAEALEKVAEEIGAVRLEEHALRELRVEYTRALRESAATMRSFVEAFETGDAERAADDLDALFGQIDRVNVVVAKLKARCARRATSP